MSFVAAIQADRHHRIVLVRTQDKTGQNAYYFIQLGIGKEHTFFDTIKREGVANLNEYGEIITSGFGHQILPHSHDILKEKFQLTVNL